MVNGRRCRRLSVDLCTQETLSDCIEMAKYLAQLVMLGSQAVGRAFRQALRQEYQASMSARRAAEEEGRSGSKAAQASSLTGMSLNEAKQILNVQNLDDTAVILKNYEHLHQINTKSTGGSFYLQSKVFRARERIEMELNTPLVAPESIDKKTT